MLGKWCRLTKSGNLHKSAIAFLVALSLSLQMVNCSAAVAEYRDAAAGECVVLLHGLWRTGWSMKRIEWALEDAGYPVVNVSYPSLNHGIEELSVIAVENGVTECRLRHLDRISFVTHSLGGILLRQYLADRDIVGLHRVVMLAPPNQGSQLADFYHGAPGFALFEPAAVAQLGTGEDSLPRRLGPVSFELGIIAGTRNLRAYLPGVPEGPGDGTVSVAETVVPGMLDFLELPVSHTFIMWSGAVLEQVVAFLREGRFERS